MIKLIVGVKGTGKTKMLIRMVNETVETSKGAVICMEKGIKLRYDIKYQARLIDTDKYFVSDAQSLYGFIAGILASNHDVTDIFVDSVLKICNHDLPALEKMLGETEKFAESFDVNIVMTLSMPPEELSDNMKKYIFN